ncbi:MAG TPA: glycosyltransferase family 4 protein [Panacibacter sp.]|nr:glycosyltransferase family 4 protein [Panacibacter sp.]
MNKTKVLIAHSWSDVGINIQTKAVAKKLSETREVLYITQARINQTETGSNNNPAIEEWPSKRPNTIKDFLFICKKIWQHKPQILIVHFGATNICMLAAWLMRVKYRICWLHTLTEQFYLDTADPKLAAKAIKLRRRAYGLATHVVVINQYGKRDAQNGYGIKADKITVIPNGIMRTNLVNKADENKKSIRFLGRIEKSKGIDILIEAFKSVAENDNDICLEIAGKGSGEKQLRQWVNDNGLTGRVIFHGYFSDYWQSADFIAGACCLVVPSRMDNFPTVVLEAMSAAVPVIASAAGGIPEMIIDGEDGILFETGNIEQLATAIKKIIADTGYRNKLALNAAKSFENRFSIGRHVNNVTAFLDSLK